MTAVTAQGSSGGGGGGGDSSDDNKTFVNVNVTGEHGGGVEEWMSRKRRDSPCTGGSRDVMDVDVGMEVEGEGGGEQGRKGGEVERDITSFSPYAARLGSGTSPEDDVGR